MKCNNCGHANAPNQLKCDKCNVPLKGSMIAPLGNIAGDDAEQSLSGYCKNCGTANAASALKCSNCNAPLTGTLSGDGKKQKKTPPPVEAGSADTRVMCPNCSYPNVASAVACISCGKVFSNAVNNQTASLGKNAKPIVEEQRKVRSAISGTVNPWTEGWKNTEQFYLEPVARPEETSQTALAFKGKTIELSRDNLEPDNETITSSVQAIIECRDGQWMIRNNSSHRTTFVQVPDTESVPLKDGDIILMGNRMFIFKEKQEG